MRPGIRTIFPAVLAAFFVLLCMQQVSATEHLATPISELEPTTTREGSPLNHPSTSGEPIVFYDYPDLIGPLPGAEYRFTIGWNLSDVDFQGKYGIVPYRVSYLLSMIFDGSEGSHSMIQDYDRHGPTAYNSFRKSPELDGELAAICIANDGSVKGTLDFSIFVDNVSETIYRAEPHSFEIHCSILAAPLAPNPQMRICGSDNDILNIPDQPDGVTVDSGSWSNGERIVTYSPANWAMFPDDFETTYTFADAGDCPTDPPVVPELITATCGDDNDVYSEPDQPENVSMQDSGWINNERTFTFSAADNYKLPDGFEPVHTVTDAGDCPTDPPVPPGAPVAVCGPNNDILGVPDQPERVEVEDSGWIENERTIEFIAAEGYVFPDNTKRIYTFRDEDIACEEDLVTTTLIVTFKTPDDGSLEGTPYSFYALAASQVAQEPFAEGEIGPGNQIVIEDLIAGTYRLVVDAGGYECIDELIEVSADSASEEHVITLTAREPVETPTPSPTPSPTAEAAPSPSPTAEPTTEAVPVTALPTTGSGPGSGVGAIMLAGLVTALVMGALANRRRSFS